SGWATQATPALSCLCVLRVVVLLEGEPSPQSEVLSTLEQVLIKDLSVLCSVHLLAAESKGRRDFRSYEKPWQIHPKKPKKSKSDLAVSNISPPSPESKSLPRSIEHPSWEWRESKDFDELNHILQESKKLGKALENLSRTKSLENL
uniref:Chromosome 8 open reading frame 34 n=1 Tax=Hucho hucho TaxID=62062 RepID=A0A4W5PCJ6_9TELE